MRYSSPNTPRWEVAWHPDYEKRARLVTGSQSNRVCYHSFNISCSYHSTCKISYVNLHSHTPRVRSDCFAVFSLEWVDTFYSRNCIYVLILIIQIVILSLVVAFFTGAAVGHYTVPKLGKKKKINMPFNCSQFFIWLYFHSVPGLFPTSPPPTQPPTSSGSKPINSHSIADDIWWASLYMYLTTMY